MHVLVADEFFPDHLGELRALGFDVTYDPQSTADDLAFRAPLREANILIVRSTRVNRPTIETARRLGLVIRAGAGFDTIDVAAASERGILVSNCPGKNSVAVAELAMGLVLALDRRIPEAASELRAGLWNKTEYGKADGLKGKTLGIAGLGRVGSELAKRARAFEMRVVAWSRQLHPDRAKALGVERCTTLRELAEVSDVLSVHLPQSAETRGLFGAEVFACMKRRAIFINTSRGAVVDEAALAEAMREKDLRVGLDVFEKEPPEGVATFRAALTGAGAFVGTPHIGASTEQAQRAIASETVRICGEFLRTGTVANAVNIEEQAPAECQLVVRHYDKVGVLAAVLGVLRAHDMNVEEMTNRIFQGAKTAVAVIRLSRMPDPLVLAEIVALEGAVIAAEAKRL
jgi:D-3-phosphoglycerate dehydrogenase / 2-oxoglutarate reductase